MYGVAEGVARAMVEVHEERRVELERRQLAYAEYRRRRDLERTEIGQRAFENAYAREHERESRLLSGVQPDGGFAVATTVIALSPGGLQAASLEAEEARNRFDADNPIEPAELFEEVL